MCARDQASQRRGFLNENTEHVGIYALINQFTFARLCHTCTFRPATRKVSFEAVKKRKSAGRFESISIRVNLGSLQVK